MAVSNSQITIDDLLLPLERPSGFPSPTPSNFANVRYELVEAVVGMDVNLTVAKIPLDQLDAKGDEYIRIKLWVFRNGQKLYFGNGFTIDILLNKLILAYEAENEDFEIYLYP